jgi:hypothetical protein
LNSVVKETDLKSVGTTESGLDLPVATASEVQRWSLSFTAASEVQRWSLSFTAASEVHEGAHRFGGEDPDRLGPTSIPYFFSF